MSVILTHQTVTDDIGYSSAKRLGGKQ